MRSFVILCGALMLGACAEQIEITEPPVAVGVIQGVSNERIANSTEMTVRTFTSVDGERAEVGGLACTLRSDELSAQFNSPASVFVPRFVQSNRFENRGRPTPLLIRCEGNGLSGVVSQDAESKQISTATNAGIAGAILTTAISAAAANSTPWKFADRVDLAVD